MGATDPKGEGEPASHGNPTTRAQESDQPQPPGDPLGRVYTGMTLARAICRTLLANGVKPRTVLDPHLGRGDLIRAAKEMWPNVTALGLDIDTEATGYRECDRSEKGADWLTYARFWDRLPLSTFCPLKRREGAEEGEYWGVPDLILDNPPFGKAIGIRVTIEHVLATLRLCPHVVTILPLPYLCGQEFDTVWQERRPAVIYRIPYRPWPDRLREVAVFEWNEWLDGPTQIRELDFGSLPPATPPG